MRCYNPDPQRREHRLAHADSRTLKDIGKHAALWRVPAPTRAPRQHREMCVHTLHGGHARAHTHTPRDVWRVLPADEYRAYLNPNSFPLHSLPSTHTHTYTHA